MESGKTVGTGFEIEEFQVYFAPVARRKTFTARFYEGGGSKKTAGFVRIFFDDSLSVDNTHLLDVVFVFSQKYDFWKNTTQKKQQAIEHMFFYVILGKFGPSVPMPFSLVG